jgi:hypothetical protein
MDGLLMIKEKSKFDYETDTGVVLRSVFVCRFGLALAPEWLQRSVLMCAPKWSVGSFSLFTLPLKGD